MSQIFISYSRKDMAIAEKIIDALAKNDLEPWVDWKSIPKGEEFEREIQQGIEKAQVFLFLVSPDSVQSYWCNLEIEHALKNGKRILPIVISDTELKNIHSKISRLNWILCRDGKDDFNKAIEETYKTIHADYEWLKYHTELQVKALKWEQKKDTSRLLRGKELREAMQTLAEVDNQEDPQPTKIQREYILVSQRDEIRVRRQITAGLVLGLGVIAILTFAVWRQQKITIEAQNTAVSEANAKVTAVANEEIARVTAQADRTRAEEQANIAIARQSSAQASALFATGNSKQMVAVLIAIQSMRMFPLADAAQILQSNQLAFLGPSMMHDDSVNSAAFSADGRYVVTGGWDKTVRVWEVITGKEVARMTHSEVVNSVAFSPDGKYVVSGSDDKTARVWEAITGKEIAHMIHDDAVSSVSFSPDGKHIVSGSQDHTARIWESSTGKESARMTHDDWVKTVAFSPDGKYVVSGGCDKNDPIYYCITGSARVWEASTGSEIARMTHENEVRSFAFSPDGNYLASGGDTTVRIWETLTGREIARMNHDGNVLAIAFSPDGNYVVSGSADNTARVWEVSTGREVTRVIHEEMVSSVVFSPDGKYVLSGSWDKTARVWSAMTGREVARMTHDNYVKSVAFSRDGKNAVSVGDNSVRVWKISRDNEDIQFLHDDRVNTIAFSPDGRYVISGSDDNTARVWEVSTQREVARMTHDDWVSSVAFSPDGKYVISGSIDSTARVWEALTGKEIARMTHGFGVNSVAFSPDGKHVASAGCDESDLNDFCVSGSARVWESTTGKEIARTTYYHSVSSVAFSPDGKYVISGGCDESDELNFCINGSARVWEALTGNEIDRFSHDDRINTVAISADGKYAVSGSGEQHDYSTCIWEIAITSFSSWECIIAEGSVNSVAFSPDGQYVVSGSDDATARLWESLLGKTMVTEVTLTGDEVARVTHNNSVTSVAFSPDGKYVISGSFDDTARVWEATTGKEVFRGTHDKAVSSVVFSPDGKFVATGSWDNTIRVQLWRPEDLIADACLHVTRNLTREEWKQYIGDVLQYQAVCPNLPIELVPTPIP